MVSCSPAALETRPRRAFDLRAAGLRCLGFGMGCPVRVETIASLPKVKWPTNLRLSMRSVHGAPEFTSESALRVNRPRPAPAAKEHPHRLSKCLRKPGKKPKRARSLRKSRAQASTECEAERRTSRTLGRAEVDGARACAPDACAPDACAPDACAPAERMMPFICSCSRWSLRLKMRCKECRASRNDAKSQSDAEP